MAFAPPAASAPPQKVAIISVNDGQPRSASTIVGIVVTSNNSTIRGFVNAM